MAKAFEQPKDPNDIARYWYDFGPLMIDGETIVGTPDVTIAIRGSNASSDLIVVGSPVVVGGRVFAILTGGTARMTYTVEFEIETSEGQTFNRAATLQVRDL